MRFSQEVRTQAVAAEAARARPRRHNSRDVDWLLAVLAVGFGVYLLAMPDVFSIPQYAGFVGRGIEEDTFGAVMMAVGAVWMAGLWINGAWSRSPFLRLVCAVLGAGLWGAVEAGFLASEASSAVATYGIVWLFSIYACARCGEDARKAYLKCKGRGGANGSDT